MGRSEANPLLGKRPSSGQVDMYFGVVAILNVTIWALLPKGWRSAPTLAIIGLEADTIYFNRNTTAKWCGVSG